MEKEKQEKGKVILRKGIREWAYKLILNPLYHLKYLLRYGLWDFTDEISIGTSSYCNLRCDNCPNKIYENGLKKNEVLMSDDLFYKIIDELGKMNYNGTLGFCFFSDPLVDERLAKFVKYAREHVPKAKMQIHTNGLLLTLDKYKELVANGVNGFTISQYTDQMAKNLIPILEYDKNNGKYISYRIFTDDIRESVGGEIEGNILEKPRCSYPDHPLVISSKGKMVLCCNDYHSSVVWGDLKNEKLVDIFNKKAFKLFRKNAKKRKFDFPVCKKCRGIKD